MTSTTQGGTNTINRIPNKAIPNISNLRVPKRLGRAKRNRKR